MEGIAIAAPIQEPDVVAVVPKLLLGLLVWCVPIGAVIESGKGDVEVSGEISRIFQSRGHELVACLHLIEALRKPHRAVVQPFMPNFMGKQIPALCGQDSVGSGIIT